MKPFPIALCAALLALPALAQAPDARTVELKGPDGAVVGAASLRAAPHGVLLRIEAKGLAPGWHGLHFHEKADCSKADFTSAGGHVHGEGERVHGLLNPAANEAGDLPNLHAAEDGTAHAEVFSALTTLEALLDADGSALVVHAAADDHTSQPIGGAGARVACGEIR